MTIQTMLFFEWVSQIGLRFCGSLVGMIALVILVEAIGIRVSK